MQIAFAMPTKMPPEYCGFFCETEVEDEVHFICFCPLYKELRQKYIHRYLKTNILLRSWCSVTRKAQVKTLHFLYFMPVKKKT